VAVATAEGLAMVAASMNGPGGKDAAQLRIAEEYVKQFGSLARTNNTMIVPANLTDVAGIVATAMSMVSGTTIKATSAN
jgi:hypothetical protein